MFLYSVIRIVLVQNIDIVIVTSRTNDLRKISVKIVCGICTDDTGSTILRLLLNHSVNYMPQYIVSVTDEQL